jgi:hypothetical protein
MIGDDSQSYVDLLTCLQAADIVNPRSPTALFERSEQVPKCEIVWAQFSWQVARDWPGAARPDSVQVMFDKQHIYVGHMFSRRICPGLSDCFRVGRHVHSISEDVATFNDDIAVNADPREGVVD